MGHCHVCRKVIALNHHALQCNNCKSSIHKKCNKLNDLDFRLLKSSKTWFCIMCIYDLIPFSDVSDQELKLIFLSERVPMINDLPNNLSIFPTSNKINIFNEFNNFFSSQKLIRSDI